MSNPQRGLVRLLPVLNVLSSVHFNEAGNTEVLEVLSKYWTLKANVLGYVCSTMACHQVGQTQKGGFQLSGSIASFTVPFTGTYTLQPPTTHLHTYASRFKSLSNGPFRTMLALHVNTPDKYNPNIQSARQPVCLCI